MMFKSEVCMKISLETAKLAIGQMQLASRVWSLPHQKPVLKTRNINYSHLSFILNPYL